MEEHSLSKRPSSLLLNDLQSDPDSFGAHPEQLIYQLMLLSLLYEEILIPDETIVLSDKITQWLSSPAGFNQWTQLLDLGSITFLLHPTRAYDERDNELRDLSEKHPFLARAKHLQGRATKHGAEFRLDESLSSVLHR